jgi:hypothetical protein
MAIDRIWHKPKGSRRKILRWRVRIRTKLEDGTPSLWLEARGNDVAEAVALAKEMLAVLGR